MLSKPRNMSAKKVLAGFALALTVAVVVPVTGQEALAYDTGYDAIFMGYVYDIYECFSGIAGTICTH